MFCAYVLSSLESVARSSPHSSHGSFALTVALRVQSYMMASSPTIALLASVATGRSPAAELKTSTSPEPTT